MFRQTFGYSWLACVCLLLTCSLKFDCKSWMPSEPSQAFERRLWLSGRMLVFAGDVPHPRVRIPTWGAAEVCCCCRTQQCPACLRPVWPELDRSWQGTDRRSCELHLCTCWTSHPCTTWSVDAKHHRIHLTSFQVVFYKQVYFYDGDRSIEAGPLKNRHIWEARWGNFQFQYL